MRGSLCSLVLAASVLTAQEALSDAATPDARISKHQDSSSNGSTNLANELLGHYQKIYISETKKIEKSYTGRLATLKESYISYLSKLKDREQAEGDTRGFIEISSEISRVRLEEGPKEESPLKEINDLREKYSSNTLYWENEKNRQAKDLITKWNVKMTDLRSELTRRGKIANAIVIDNAISSAEEDPGYISSADFK